MSSPTLVFVKGYCVKCRAIVELVNPQRKTLGNGRTALQGPCPTCATKVTTIGKGAAPVASSRQQP